MSFVAAAIGGSALIGAVGARSAARTQSRAAQEAGQLSMDAGERAAQQAAAASDRAAQATLQGTRESNTLLRTMFDQNRRDAQPYMDAGQRALLGLEAGMEDRGPGGMGRDIAYDPNIAALSRSAADIAGERFNFEEDPGYQFRLAEGNRALDRAASAGGRFDSGRAMKDLLRYGQGFASNEYGAGFDRFQRDRGDRFGMTTGERTSQFNMAAGDRDSRFNRLSSLAGTGQSVTGQIGQQGMSMAGAAGSNTMAGTQGANNYSVGGTDAANRFRTGGANAYGDGITGAANARASGYVGAANAVNSGVGQGIGMYQGNRMMDLLRPRAGAPGSTVGAAMPYTPNPFARIG